MIASALKFAFSTWPTSLLRPKYLWERDGVPLPPTQFRAAGALFEANQSFQAYARADIELITRFVDLKRASVLDFGCGVGRFYFGLRPDNEPRRYLGVDVKPDVIAWASREITASNPRFEFRRLDIHNERYNPAGTLDNGAWSSILAEPFDAIYSYSVLSHMVESDARCVLDTFSHHLTADGRLFLTAFVGQQQENVVVNPADRTTKGPLHIVRYRRTFFIDDVLRQFAIVAEHPEAATDGQTIYVLRKRRETAA